ncbi:MAG: hypothetical protein ACHQT9_02715 [Candidatus Saccharimonadales bacterium]
MKVVFIGHPGSGKTYAASTLAKQLGTKEVDIDDLLHNWVYFVLKRPYRKAFNKLLDGKTSWIIDGYAGKRMPATVWGEADYIVYINLPRTELRQNIYKRYRLKKSNNESSHGQQLFANILKNLWQIYILDGSLKKCINNIEHSPCADKLIELHSRQELNQLINKLASGS